MRDTKIHRNSATDFTFGHVLSGNLALMLGQLRFPAKPDTLLGCNDAPI